MYYYPLLRNANNEMKALRELKEDSRTKVIPIIESKRVKRETATNWQSTFNTVGRYLKDRVKDMTFIYDFDTALEELGEGIQLETNTGENLVQHCLTKMKEENLNVIPCFQHDSPEWIISSVLRSDYPEIAIRVRCHDFQESFNPFVYAKLKQDLEVFDVKAQITVILDFFTLPTTQNRIQNTISTFSKINNAKLVYLATSCPENASNADVHSITLIGPRTEYNNYLKLLQSNNSLLFGDYTTRLKGEVLSGFNHNNSYLKIFYSTETDYWIAKSKLIKDGGEYTFNEVCRYLIDYDFYPGSDFSFGDSEIKKCADNEVTISDHQAPIAIGVNHHIETTVAQLSLISNSVSV
jgi:Beta protein